MEELYTILNERGDYVGSFEEFEKDYAKDNYKTLHKKLAQAEYYTNPYEDFVQDYKPVKSSTTTPDTVVETEEIVSDPLKSSDTESALVSNVISKVTPKGKEDEGIFASSLRSFMQGLEGVELGQESAELMQAFEDGTLSKRDYQEYIAANNNVQDNKEIASIGRYEKAYSQYIAKGENGTIATLKALWDNPDAGFPMAMNSIATVGSAPFLSKAVGKAALKYGAAGATAGAGVSAAAGALGGPVGSAVAGLTGGVSGGINGLMFGAMKQLETQLFFSEELNNGIKGELTEEKISRFFSNKKNVEEIINNAELRGIGVAAIETMFKMLPVKAGGAALKMISKRTGAGVAGKVVAVAGGAVAAAGTEAAVGMTGEATGMIMSGKELDAKQIIEEGILGPYGKVVGVAGYIGKVRMMQDEVKASSLLKNSNLDSSAAKAFDPNLKVGEAQVGISKLKNGQKIVDYEVDRMVNRSDISEQEGKDIKQNFRDVQGGSNRLKSLKLDNAAEAEAINKLRIINKLKQDIKEIDNKALSAQKQAQLDTLNEELNTSDSELFNVIKKDAAQKVEKDVSFVKKAAEALKFKVVDNLSTTEILQKFGKKEAAANGFFKDGTIYINKEVAAETRAVTVGSHELLHGILANAAKIDEKIIEQFKSKLTEDQIKLVDKKLTDNYEADYIKDNPDEFITQFSDLIAEDKIKYNDTLGTMLLDVVTPILRAAGFKNIKFDSGEQIYDFMREYSKSMKSGNLSGAIIKAVPGGVKIKDTKTTESRSKRFDTKEILSTNTDTINELATENKTTPFKQNSTQEKDLLRQYTNVALKALGYRKGAGTIAPQEAVSFVNSKFKGIMNRFNPKESKFSTWVTSNITPKRMEFYDSQIGDAAVTTSIDDERAGQIADIPTETKTNKKRDVKPTTNPLKLFGSDDKARESFIKNTIDKIKELGSLDLINSVFGLGLPSNIDNLTYKTLKTLDEQGIADLTGIPVNKIFQKADNLNQDAINALMYINKNAQAILNMLPDSHTEIKSVVSKSNPNKMVKIGGESTGVPQNVLNKFYDKGKRVGNNTQWTKKPNLTVEKLRDELGMEGTIKDPTFKARTNTSQSLKGILELVGRGMTNTVARNYLESIGYNPLVINNIAEGKNPSMFSTTKVKEISGINIFQQAALESAKDDFNSFNTSSWKPFYDKMGVSPLDPSSWADKMEMVDFFQKVLPQYLPQEIIALLGPTMTNGPASYYKANSDKFNEAAKANPKKYPTQILNSNEELVNNDKLRAASKEKFVLEALGIKNIDETVDYKKADWSKISNSESFFFKDSKQAGNEGAKYQAKKDHKSPTVSKQQLADMKVMFYKQGFTSGKGNKRTVQNKFLETLWQSNELKAQNAAKLRGLKAMFEVFEQMMKDDSKNAKYIIGILSKTSGHQNGFVRVSAPMKFIAKNILGVEIVEEHTLPASLAAKYLFQQAVSGTVNKNFKGIERNYMQGILSKLDDNKLKGIGIDGKPFNYIKSTPEGFTLNDNIWARYFNLNVATIENGFGIDPNNLELETGKTVAETFGVNNAGADIAGIKSVERLKAEYNKKIGPAIVPQEVQEESLYSKSPKFSTSEILNNFNLIDKFNNKQESNFTNSLSLDKDFNDIIENKTGIASEKTYSKVKAEVVGSSKGKFDWFIPPSAEDFVGLLYKTLGKGKIGDSQMAWYKAHLLNPFSRAMDNISRSRVALGNDFKALKNKLNVVPKTLKKKLPGENFTQEQAIRVYIWNKQGTNIPGMSETDIKELKNFIENNNELRSFADELMQLQKGDQYAKPSESWLAGNITTDLMEGINTIKRAKFLEQWQQNVDKIFTEANLNKLEAAYGKSYRNALESSLQRMKTGKNRSFGGDTLTGRVTDWLTNSIGAIMFFNTRSAVLQTISAINFINFGDNNIYAAGKAFANQKQYWSDFKKLFNSDFLVERRDGLKLNVNEADIAEMAKKGGPKGVIAGLLRLGFLPTQIADSFAIASGGSTFYRNRLEALEKQGMSKKDAETQAFQDFRETAEESQQSSRPDRISQQQAGPLGRIILAFANTPAQYARIIKKAAIDLKNRRGDAKTNISKIIYYGIAQNLIFNAMQQALFALAFEDEDEDEKEKRAVNVANGMADSVLRGTGLAGAVVSVLKNVALRLNQESGKKSPKYQDVLQKEILQISPPISSKVGKLRSAGRSFSWNKKDMMTKGWSIENPAYLAAGQIIAATTNVPLDRVIKKINNIKNSSDSKLQVWQRIASLAGWSEWELGIQKSKQRKTKIKKYKVKKRV